jgi:hypothetical protein
MNRSHAKAAVVGSSVIAALAVASAGLSTAAGQTTGPTTLTLTARVDNNSFAIHKAKPKSTHHNPGDVMTFAIALVKDGKPFGRVEATQLAVDGRYQAVSFHYTLLLADGTVEILGAGVDKQAPGTPKPSDADPAAIVGGTGAYDGARGSFILREGPHGDTITLTYTR